MEIENDNNSNINTNSENNLKLIVRGKDQSPELLQLDPKLQNMLDLTKHQIGKRTNYLNFLI